MSQDHFSVCSGVGDFGADQSMVGRIARFKCIGGWRRKFGGGGNDVWSTRGFDGVSLGEDLVVVKDASFVIVRGCDDWRDSEIQK